MFHLCFVVKTTLFCDIRFGSAALTHIQRHLATLHKWFQSYFWKEISFSAYLSNVDTKED